MYDISKIKGIPMIIMEIYNHGRGSLHCVCLVSNTDTSKQSTTKTAGLIENDKAALSDHTSNFHT